MELYGIENVRGGNYCKIILNNNDINHINKLINGNNNLCYRCGRNNHFIKECYATYHKNGKIIELYDEFVIIDSNNTFCNRCGRNSHNDENCYAKKHINGIIKESDTCIIS